MILFKKEKDIISYLGNETNKTAIIGFVPTMGALHKGHLSLIEKTKADCQIVVCSIFVNPTQFNDAKDFEKYPSTIEQDIFLIEQAGCDVLLLPSVQEMYPNGLQDNRKYELGFLETILEGKYRPGHFQGVCMVVHRLLNIVQPTKLYLGQKDYQQCMVIAKLLQLIGSNIQLEICNTVREPNGLAMSSRNMRLTEIDKEKVTEIFKALQLIKSEIKPGNITKLKQAANHHLTAVGFKVDYVEIADSNNLEVVEQWDGQRKLVILIAAFLSDVRLIDNLLI